MPATPLPSSGNSPETPGNSPCSASGMIEIHRLYRAGFGEGPDLVNRVRPGDLAHAQAVADNLALLSLSLHAHHEGEDLRLWDALEDRAPACAVHVERMKQQHAQMLVHLDALAAALTSWRATASAADAAPILAALFGINETLKEHLGDEEANIVPVMEKTLTEAEMAWFGEHGRSATPKKEMWNSLGAILAAQPDGGVEWSHKNLPAPARFLWRVSGKRKYEARRRALLGG